MVGRGTAWLARREPGDTVFAWGPLGRGYSLPRQGSGQALLLVGGGIGIAPLLWLADEAVAKGSSVVLIDGARDARGVFPAELVPSEVEVVVTTQDGSQGRQGLVTDVFMDYYGWADQAYLCGPNPMFAAIAELMRAQEGSQRARRPQAGAGAAGVADGLRHRHLLRLRGLRPPRRTAPGLQRRAAVRAERRFLASARSRSAPATKVQARVGGRTEFALRGLT